MTYKKLPTKKLFYGQWPYKVETHVEGAWFVRHWGLVLTLARKGAVVDKLKLLALDTILAEVKINKNLQARIERNHANFFTNSPEEVEKICELLGTSVKAVYMPMSDQELELLKSNKQILIVDHYPYKKYTHKIYLKGNAPFEQRKVIFNWLKSVPSEDIKISDVKWFFTDRNWWGSPSVYFKNERVVSMLSLIAGDHIKKIEKYVLRSSINTGS